jgi:hypothetical protein
VFNTAIAEKKSTLGLDPIGWNIIAGSIPLFTSIGNNYTIVYQFNSNLPFPMPTPLFIRKRFSTFNEFTFTDNCSGLKLPVLGNCIVSINFTPNSAGAKLAFLIIEYGDNKVPLPPISTTTTSW